LQAFYAAEDAIYDTSFRAITEGSGSSSTNSYNFQQQIDHSGFYSGVLSSPSIAVHALETVSSELSSFGALANSAQNGKQSENERRKLFTYATGQDIVLVYHHQNWDNMLTSQSLQHVCEAEMGILDVFESCAGLQSMATIVPIVFRKNCTYKIPFRYALSLLTSPANSEFVQDSLQHGARGVQSAVILSYLSWECLGYTTQQIESKFAKALKGIPIEVTYAQIDHLNNQVTMAIYADVQLLCMSVIGAFLVVGYFYVSMGAAVVCATICTVVVSTSLLITFDYTSLSVLNMLALLFSSVFGSFYAFAFVEAWERCYKHTSPINRQNRPTNLNHKFLLVTYRTIQTPINLSFAIFFTSFISIYYLYPVISVAQLGQFLFTSLVGVFVFMHVILVPGWICVIRLRRMAEVTERLGLTRATIIEHPDDEEDDAAGLEERAASSTNGSRDHSDGNGSENGSRTEATISRSRANSHDSTVPGITLVDIDAHSVAGSRRAAEGGGGGGGSVSSRRNRPPRHPQSGPPVASSAPRRPAEGSDDEGSVTSARSGRSVRSARSNQNGAVGQVDGRGVYNVPSYDSDEDTVDTVEVRRRREAAARSLQITPRAGGNSPTRVRSEDVDDRSVQSGNASVRSARSSHRRSERRSERAGPVSVQDPEDDDTVGSLNSRARPPVSSVHRSRRVREISGLTDYGTVEETDESSGDEENRIVDVNEVQLGADGVVSNASEADHAVIEAVYVTEEWGQADARKQSLRMSRGITWPVLILVVAFCIVIPIYMISYSDYGEVTPNIPVLIRQSENQGEISLIGSKYRHDLMNFRGSTASSYLSVNMDVLRSGSGTRRTLAISEDYGFDNARFNQAVSQVRVLGMEVDSVHKAADEPSSVPTSPPPTASPTDVPPTSVPTGTPTTSPTLSPYTAPSLMPSATPTSLPSGEPSSGPTTSSPTESPTTAPSATPTTSAPSNVPTSSVPTAIPTSAPTAIPTTSAPSNVPTSSVPTAIPTSAPTAIPTTGAPSSMPTSSVPTAIPTSAPTATPTTGAPSSVPTSSCPTAIPTVVPTAHPTVAPTLTPTMTPTVSPTQSPTTLPTHSSTTNISAFITYSTQVCFGINTFQESEDGIYKAQFSPSKFDSYVATGGLMADLEDVCHYVINHSHKLDLSDIFQVENCMYSQLSQIMSVDGSDVFDALYRWVSSPVINITALGDIRSNHIGINKQGVVYGGGNFGANKEYELLWVCESFPNIGDVESMYANRDHAIHREARWGKFLEKEASAAKDEAVSVKVSSAAWLFPDLYTSMKQSALYCLLLVVAVCLILVTLFTSGDLKLVGVIVLSVIFITIMSLGIHMVIINDRIDLQNFIAIFLFSGCIAYFPAQMATRFHFTASRIPLESRKSDFHLALFKVLWRSTAFQCLLLALVSVPLLFAHFALIAKVGQYGVVVGVVSGVYVCGVMPVLLRLQEESTCVPVQKYF
jgi:hypothetical protein